jgi:transcription initiation factor TFIIIB Brf1 subunit/transcription initiation factor TFIIB
VRPYRYAHEARHDAPPEERIAYLMRFVEALSDETTEVRKHAEAIVQEAEVRSRERMEISHVDSTGSVRN